MNTTELANAFAAMLREGKFAEAGATFWSPDIVSIEAYGIGDKTRWVGLAEVKGKSDWWEASHEVHSFTTEGPYVNGDAFVLKFTIDVTHKESGQRVQGPEMALYMVKDDKIVEERFFGVPMG